MTKTLSLTFLEPGDKVLVVHRRLFREDRARFFAGRVDGFNEQNGLLKVTGHSIAESREGQKVVKKRQARTKILSLTSGTLIVYQLPAQTDVGVATLVPDKNGILWFTDGKAVQLDVTELPSP